MYLEKLSTQRRVVLVSRQVINTGEGWVYLDRLSTQGRIVVISRLGYQHREGWVYLDKLSRHRGGSPVVII